MQKQPRKKKKKKSAEEAFAPHMFPGTAPPKDVTMPVRTDLIKSGELKTPAARRSVSPLHYDRLRTRFLKLLTEGNFNDPAFNRNPWEYLKEELSCTSGDIGSLMSDVTVHAMVTNAWLLEVAFAAPKAIRKMREMMDDPDVDPRDKLGAAREILSSSTRAVQSLARLSASRETASYAEAQGKELRSIARDLAELVREEKTKAKE